MTTQGAPEIVRKSGCWPVRIGVVILFAGIVVISGIHGYLGYSLLSFVLLIALLLPVYPFIRLLIQDATTALVFTFPAGYVIHAIFLSLLGKFFHIGTVVFLIYLALWLIPVILWRKKADENTSEFSDFIQLFLWLFFSMVLIAIPYFNVGRPTQEGLAYRAYFNADFFRHMAVAANLAHAGIPPDNPYFSGEILRYYWFFHILPAYWIRLLPDYSLDYLMLQFHLVISLMFVACLYSTVRQYTTRSATRWLLLPVFLLGGSYEGLYVLAELHERNLSFWAFREWNIDAILRWFWGAPQVDTLYRALLYAPQHLIGLCIFLLFLLTWKTASELRQRMLLYFLLFAVTGFTVILAGALILGVGVLLLLEFLRMPRGKWKEVLFSTILGLSFLVVYFFLFHMFGKEAGDLKFEIDTRVLRNLIGFFVLNWGAILILGLTGIFRSSSPLPKEILLIYLVLSVLLILFVNIQVPGQSEITLKMGFLSYVILLLFAASFLDAVKTKWAVWITGLLILPGALTFFMDICNNQDIQNRKFTSYIHPDDEEVYRWIARNTEGSATIQSYSLAGKGFLSEYVTEIPALAQRAVYLGDKVQSRVYQITEEQIKTRKRIVRELFNLRCSGQISMLAQRAGIEYILLHHKDDLRGFEAHLQEPYFTLVKRSGNARLYRVNPRKISVEEMEVRVLKQQPDGTTVLTADFVHNFYKPEMQTNLETARWMSQDAVILLDAAMPLTGTFSFNACAFEKNRSMQVFLDGRLLKEQGIDVKGSKILLPLELSSGQHHLMIHAPEGTSSSGGSDSRSLSFRIWNLQWK